MHLLIRQWFLLLTINWPAATMLVFLALLMFQQFLIYWTLENCRIDSNQQFKIMTSIIQNFALDGILLESTIQYHRILTYFSLWTLFGENICNNSGWYVPCALCSTSTFHSFSLIMAPPKLNALTILLTRFEDCDWLVDEPPGGTLSAGWGGSLSTKK